MDLLGKCVSRNPYTNQYELKKNMNALADDLEKEAKEVGRKMKIVERKEN